MLLLFIFRIKIHSIILQSYALITYEDNSNATWVYQPSGVLIFLTSLVYTVVLNLVAYFLMNEYVLIYD